MTGRPGADAPGGKSMGVKRRKKGLIEVMRPPQTLARSSLSFFLLLLPAWAGANAPLNLVKTMFPLVVQPGDTVTICLDVTQPAVQPMADIAWVLDITGSMAAGISAIQANISAFTTQLASQGINYQQALVTFSDPGLTSYGFATSDAQFNGFVSTAASFVSLGLGGDLPENALEGLYYAANNLPWRANASHTMILVTDACTHAQGFDNLSPYGVTTTAVDLHSQGFFINAICNTEPVMTAQFCPGPPYGCGTPPGPIAMGDPGLIPPLAGGQWLSIVAPGSAWTSFLSGLGTAVADYSNVVLTDPLPPQLQPLPLDSDGATITANTLSWTVTNLGQGQGFSHCVLTLVRPGYYGAVTNTASVDADGTTATGTTASPIFYVTYTDTATPTATRTPTPTVTISSTITTTFTITPTFTVTPTWTPTPRPLTLSVRDPYPNPVQPGDPAGELVFSLGSPAWVDLQVWTVSGEPIRHWQVANLLGQGDHESAWDLRNDAGSTVSSGIYIFRIRARNERSTQMGFGKIAVLR
jgi:hypothetical protein